MPQAALLRRTYSDGSDGWREALQPETTPTAGGGGGAFWQYESPSDARGIGDLFAASPPDTSRSLSL